MSDTKYRDRDGNIHDSRSDAEAANAKGPGVSEAGANIMIAIFGPILLLGFIGILIMTFIKQYAFYILPIFGFLFLGNLFRKVLRDKSLIPVSVLLLAMVGTILFGKLIYYPYIIEPSPFTADYIAGEAAIHARRNGGGKELAIVAEGEKVTVNGVSRDRKEFNITAEDGSTGWIPAAAFPEDANIPPDDASDIVLSNLPLIGRNKQTNFARNAMARGDRDWLNRIETVIDYFIGDPSTQAEGYDSHVAPPNPKNANGYDDVWPTLLHIYGLTGDMMNRAIQVNQPFAVTINGSRGTGDNKKTFSGDVEMTLWYILYAPEATIISFLRGDHEWANEFNTPSSREREYYRSLALKDLDTGETFPFYDDIGVSGASDEFIYIFPPVKSRHFALLHEKASNGKGNHDVWDIPEVTIAANAPTMANDPYVVTQRRIADFKGNGSNAITTRQEALYSEASITSSGDREPLTLIPPGEIVTILKERPPASPYINVRYKDFEGYVGYRFLKQ